MSFVTPSFSDLCSGTVRSTLPPPKKKKRKTKTGRNVKECCLLLGWWKSRKDHGSGWGNKHRDSMNHWEGEWPAWGQRPRFPAKHLLPTPPQSHLTWLLRNSSPLQPCCSPRPLKPSASHGLFLILTVTPLPATFTSLPWVGLNSQKQELLLLENHFFTGSPPGMHGRHSAHAELWGLTDWGEGTNEFLWAIMMFG